jgi:hypothetical protein
MTKRRAKRTIVHSAAEIPSSFSSEDEEREWWASHDLSESFYEENKAGTFAANAVFQSLRSADLLAQASHHASLASRSAQEAETEVEKLQEEVQKLKDENRALQNRLADLEARLSATG